jgi:16S rRNA (uracil1498-N3)-methyltransferase
MTEVGVDEVVPWSASRSVAVWRGERGDKARERWRSTAREAAKQARRAWVPEIGPARTTAEVAGLDGTVLVLHEEAAVPLSTVDIGGGGDVAVVIGPEGGIAPEELSAFVSAGAVAVRLGASVLRTSTAGPVALAILAVRLGRW